MWKWAAEGRPSLAVAFKAEVGLGRLPGTLSILSYLVGGRTLGKQSIARGVSLRLEHYVICLRFMAWPKLY